MEIKTDMTSYPKNKIKVLLLENIHPQAQQIFASETYQVTTLKGSLSEEELIERVKNYHIIGIRSKTKITEKVILAANKLLAIGAFCIGTNQIDLTACAKHGVAVFNAPYSNTRSVVELVLGNIIALLRKLVSQNNKMHHGIWEKSAKSSYELRGKTLGIVGYGNIGAQLSVLAESLGLRVIYYDTAEKLFLGNAEKCDSIQHLLHQADIVTSHIDGDKANTHYFDKEKFSHFKQGAYFINLSRGHVVEINALKQALETHHLAGAAVDVFPQEPSSNGENFKSELQGLDNVILTPHIGGSTEEAQENIATFVPERIIYYINTGNSQMSVNFPNIKLSIFQDSHRLIHIHHNKPGVLASINKLLAQHEINIVGQYLKTNENIGYVITDISRGYDQTLLAEMEQLAHTIKFRVLY